MSPSLAELAEERGISVEETEGMVAVFKDHKVEEWCGFGREQYEWGGRIDIVTGGREGISGDHRLRMGIIREGVHTRLISNDEDIYSEIMTFEEAQQRVIAENKRRYGAERFF